MAFILPELPYDKKALEPHISEKTLEFHYGKHHNAYVTNLNKFTEGTEYEKMHIEEVIIRTADDTKKASIFNNAAQVWNHTFFWNCMKKNGGGEPSLAFKEKLEHNFGSFEKFKEEFKNAAVSQFGSGWAWLVEDDDGSLHIVKTANADTPLAKGLNPLLTVDVWEHAYYLDYQNRRPDFVQTFLDSLVNWEFVEMRVAAEEGCGAGGCEKCCGCAH